MPQIQTIKVRSWKDSYDRELEPVEYNMGLRLIDDGEKPSIHLFSIKENDGWEKNTKVDLNKCAYKICSGIVEDYFPGHTITDFDWSYTASGGHMEMDFEETGGVVTGVRFSNSFAARWSFFSAHIEDYEEALKDPDNFLNILSEGHPERYQGEPDYRVIVPLPHHPAGSIMLELATAGDNTELVLADSNKIFEFMVREQMTQYGCKTLGDLKKIYDAEPHKGDDVAFPPFHSTVEESIKHLSPESGYPRHTSFANFFKTAPAEPRGKIVSLITDWMDARFGAKPSETLGFVNGRHRMVNMIKAGAPFVPIVMDTCPETEEFKQRFGWDGHSQQLPALKMDNNPSL